MTDQHKVVHNCYLKGNGRIYTLWNVMQKKCAINLYSASKIDYQWMNEWIKLWIDN